MWILIRCLCQKPADLDLQCFFFFFKVQCFQKRITMCSARQVLSPIDLWWEALFGVVDGLLDHECHFLPMILV